MQPGGEISVLCEGQSQVFLSAPDGQLRAIALDNSSQARIYPQGNGPYTIQCGSEAKTVLVRLPQMPVAGAFGAESALPMVAGLASVFLLAAFFISRRLLRKRTDFTKQIEGARVVLRISAAEKLANITIADPDGGVEGRPLLLHIPCLADGASWSWEYEREEAGAPLAPARMSAKCAKGEINLISGASEWKGKAQERRQLPKNQA